MNDHSIFTESIDFIQKHLEINDLGFLEQKVLERLIHCTGDFNIAPLLSFSPFSCQKGLNALRQGAQILTDTEMAAAAVRPMAQRTIGSIVRSILEWAPKEVEGNSTRTAIGMQKAWEEISRNCENQLPPIILIGSSPTALEKILAISKKSKTRPSLIIGMPVGFIGVERSKERLFRSDLPFIIVKGTRGGAAMAASTANALLREAKYQKDF